MLKTFLFVAIATVQCSDIRDPVNVDGASPRLEWSYYYPSWSSIVDYFHESHLESTDSPPDFLTRLSAVEQVVKEINEILKKQTASKKIEGTTTPKIKAEVSPSTESSSMTKKDDVLQGDVQQPQPNSNEKPASNDNPEQSSNITKPSTITLIEPTNAPEAARTNDN